MTTTVNTTIDWQQPGKQIGFLDIPHSRNTSAWGVERIPCAVINGMQGDGPTILCVAGVHGDEYEGPLALNRLIHQIEAQDIQGRIIVLPAFNKAGLEQATRLSPHDGRDLNRAYPGVYDGSVGQRLVHYMAEYLIPQAELVADFHSGGTSLEFLPCAVMHETRDQVEWQRRCDLLKAFGAPYSLILEELDSTGMLDSYVENSGKMFLTTELGGAGIVTPQTIDIAREGMTRVLQHYGMLGLSANDKSIETAPPSIWCQIEQNNYINATTSGWFEPRFNLGDEVKQGDVLGYLHDLRYPQEGFETLKAPGNGIVFGRRPKVYTEQGDCLVLLASYYDPV